MCQSGFSPAQHPAGRNCSAIPTSNLFLPYPKNHKALMKEAIISSLLYYITLNKEPGSGYNGSNIQLSFVKI